MRILAVATAWSVSSCASSAPESASKVPLTSRSHRSGSPPSTPRRRTPAPAPVSRDRRALFVPAAAVQRHGQVSSVYVVQDGVASLRLIHVGGSSSEGLEVLAGLDAGESIVISPLTRLVDGAKVAIAGVPTGTRGPA